MRVITNKRLVDFGQAHPDAHEPLQVWRKLMETSTFQGYADLKNTFGSVDVAGDKTIFDIRGNHYRVIAFIKYSSQLCYIKNVLTHAEYNKGKWK